MQLSVFFLRISNLLRTSNFGLRTSSRAPDHAHTIPTVGTGRFASMPTNFLSTPRVPAAPRLHKLNSLARNDNVPGVQTQLSAPERPATDIVASPRSKYIAPHSSFAEKLSFEWLKR